MATENSRPSRPSPPGALPGGRRAKVVYNSNPLEPTEAPELLAQPVSPEAMPDLVGTEN